MRSSCICTKPIHNFFAIGGIFLHSFESIFCDMYRIGQNSRGVHFINFSQFLIDFLLERCHLINFGDFFCRRCLICLACCLCACVLYHLRKILHFHCACFLLHTRRTICQHCGTGISTNLHSCNPSFHNYNFGKYYTTITLSFEPTSISSAFTVILETNSVIRHKKAKILFSLL